MAENPRESRDAAQIASLEEELASKVEQLSVVNRQLKRKIFDLYTVFEISRNINAVLDSETLLESFVFTCLGQVAAGKGAIWLRDEPSADHFALVHAKGSGTLPPPTHRFAIAPALADHLTRLNRPVPLDGTTQQMAGTAVQEIFRMFPGGVLVPLIYKSRLTGLFLLGDKLAGDHFTADDLEFLAVLANQIAVAIENALLFESETRAVRLLRETQQQLVQTEKLAALGDMSARVAHEINNPLGIIKNYLLLIRRAADDDAAIGDYASTVGQEIDRIAGIVRQLLAFHRPQATQMLPFDLIPVLDSIVDLMARPLAAQRIELKRDYTGPAILKGASEQLKQVFLNIIINARDAMPQGGELRIGLEHRGDVVRVAFHDTGPGIPADIIPKIFEPFFTTKDRDKGTGLGLSVCYGIIKSHGGAIAFRNTETGGCFDIDLPLTPSEESS